MKFIDQIDFLYVGSLYHALKNHEQFIFVWYMMTDKATIYDYVIVGAGAAGLQLAYAMVKDQTFAKSSIAIVDRGLAAHEPKTWCFWETDQGKWDDIIDFSWSKARFCDASGCMNLQLEPYKYKKLSSRVFTDYVHKLLLASGKVEWIEDDVKAVKAGSPALVKGERVELSAKQVFDSRIDPAFGQDRKSIKVWQHFLGWEIETEGRVFDPDVFTMMDFRTGLSDLTCFMYVLPETPGRALVECTYFSPEVVSTQTYEKSLKQYIEQVLGIEKYQITMREKGIIPMTDYDFHQHHRQGVLKIGTAGGWVRASTGYSFQNAGRKVEQILENMKADRPLTSKLRPIKHAIYDRLFLDVLYNDNKLGPGLFHRMYLRNPIQRIFRFLDGTTNLWTDLRIIVSFPSMPFMKAIIRQIRGVRRKVKPVSDA